MPGDVWSELFSMQCTVIRGAPETTTNPWNPQADETSTINFTAPVATYTAVPCRIVDATGTKRHEIETGVALGTAVTTHVGYMPYADCPETLRTHGNALSPSIDHKIHSVIDAFTGDTIFSGEFNIITVYDAGEDHSVIVLHLRRIS